MAVHAAARKGRAVTYAVEKQLKVYILWKFAISMAVGLAVGTVLDSLGCDLAALFGVLTFGLNFIPTVGLLLAVVLPLPVVLLAPTCSDPSVCNGTSKGEDCDVWVPAWNSETHNFAGLDMSLAGDCWKELPDPSQLSSADFSSKMQAACNSDYCYCCGAAAVSRPRLFQYRGRKMALLTLALCTAQGDACRRPHTLGALSIALRFSLLRRGPQ